MMLDDRHAVAEEKLSTISRTVRTFAASPYLYDITISNLQKPQLSHHRPYDQPMIIANFHMLSDDNIFHILSFLDLKQNLIVGSVCKRLHKIAGHRALWKNFVTLKTREGQEDEIVHRIEENPSFYRRIFLEKYKEVHEEAEVVAAEVKKQTIYELWKLYRRKLVDLFFLVSFACTFSTLVMLPLYLDGRNSSTSSSSSSPSSHLSILSVYLPILIFLAFSALFFVTEVAWAIYTFVVPVMVSKKQDGGDGDQDQGEHFSSAERNKRYYRLPQSLELLLYYAWVYAFLIATGTKLLILDPRSSSSSSSNHSTSISTTTTTTTTTTTATATATWWDTVAVPTLAVGIFDAFAAMCSWIRLCVLDVRQLLLRTSQQQQQQRGRGLRRYICFILTDLVWNRSLGALVATTCFIATIALAARKLDGRADALHLNAILAPVYVLVGFGFVFTCCGCCFFVSMLAVDPQDRKPYNYSACCCAPLVVATCTAFLILLGNGLGAGTALTSAFIPLWVLFSCILLPLLCCMPSTIIITLAELFPNSQVSAYAKSIRNAKQWVETHTTRRHFINTDEEGKVILEVVV